MITESETKSAGIPAGATQRCTDCGRIATLTKAARSAANGLAEWKLWMNSPRNAPAETMRQYAQAMQETERDLRAALGAPEGQPPRMVVCKNMTDAHDGPHPLDKLLCVDPTPQDALRVCEMLVEASAAGPNQFVCPNAFEPAVRLARSVIGTMQLDTKSLRESAPSSPEEQLSEVKK